MGTRQWVLVLVFGLHWSIFVRLYLKQKRLTRMLPIGVFTLLILTQVFWNSAAEIAVGDYGPVPLRTAFRHSAWTLAVPSLILMFRKIVLRVRERRMRVSGEAIADAVGD